MVALKSEGVWGDQWVGVMCTVVVVALAPGHLFNSRARTSSSSSSNNSSGITTTAAATAAITTLVEVVVVVGCVAVEVGALRVTLGEEGVGLITPALAATLQWG